MIPEEIEGLNLGEKHRRYNGYVNEALNQPQPLLGFNEGTNDMENRFKVDVASHYRDVDCMLSAFKSRDMLVVSRAIKHSDWLFKDEKYKIIINPQYLNDELFPQMTNKAICKLNLHIRLNLKDKLRAGEFFKFYERKDLQVALKWLPYCTLDLIEAAVKKYQENISEELFRRLCEISFSVVQIFNECETINKVKYISKVLYFLRSHPEEYLKIVAQCKIVLDGKHTKFVLKNSLNLIMNNLDEFYNILDGKAFGNFLVSNVKKLLETYDNEYFSLIEALAVAANNWCPPQLCEYMKCATVTKALLDKDPARVMTKYDKTYTEFLHEKTFITFLTNEIENLVKNYTVEFLSLLEVLNGYKHEIKINDTLCEILLTKSPSIMMEKADKYTEFVDDKYFWNFISQNIDMLLHNHFDSFLTMIEANSTEIKLDQAQTTYILSNSPDRVTNNIEGYLNHIHYRTFEEYFGLKKVKQLFLESAERDSNFLTNYDIHRLMSKEDFTEIIIEHYVNCKTENIIKDDRFYQVALHSDYVYKLYKYFPFEIAFRDIKLLSKKQSNPEYRRKMLSILLESTENKYEHVREVIKYYRSRHINEAFKFKADFLRKFLEIYPYHTLDEDTWKPIDEIFHSMDVYIEVDTDLSEFADAILLYNILNDKAMPQIIIDKANTYMFSYNDALSEVENDKIFRTKLFYFIDLLSKKTDGVAKYAISFVKHSLIKEVDIPDIVKEKCCLSDLLYFFGSTEHKNDLKERIANFMLNKFEKVVLNPLNCDNYEMLCANALAKYCIVKNREIPTKIDIANELVVLEDDEDLNIEQKERLNNYKIKKLDNLLQFGRIEKARGICCANNFVRYCLKTNRAIPDTIAQTSDLIYFSRDDKVSQEENDKLFYFQINKFMELLPKNNDTHIMGYNIVNCANAFVEYSLLTFKEISPKIENLCDSVYCQYDKRLTHEQNINIFRFKAKIFANTILRFQSLTRYRYCNSFVMYSLLHDIAIPEIIHSYCNLIYYDHTNNNTREQNERIFNYTLKNFLKMLEEEKSKEEPKLENWTFAEKIKLSEKEKCANSFVLYSVLNGLPILSTVEQLSSINWFFLNKELHLQKHEKLLQYILKKFDEKIESEEKIRRYDVVAIILHNILVLLKQYDKEIKDYPAFLMKMKDYVRQRKMLLTWSDLTKKSWRKHFFEESLLISHSQKICLNALKFDPNVLYKFTDELQKLRSSSSDFYLFWKKLRIFWPNTLRREWMNAYKENIKHTNEHKTIARGTITLSKSEELNELIEQNKPLGERIQWGEVDNATVHFIRCIASNIHRARPQPHPIQIFWFTQGDWLQYARPSLLAIFNNLSVVQSLDHVPKLTTGPVSLLKHGIRILASKASWPYLMDVLKRILGSTKNASIKEVIFKITHDCLCNRACENKSNDIWIFYEGLIDTVTHEDNKAIFNLLTKVSTVVDLNVRGKYCLKSMRVLSSMPAHIDYSRSIFNLSKQASEMISTLDQNIVKEIIIHHIKNNITLLTSKYVFYDLIVAFFLSCNSVEQMERYKKTIKPIIEICTAKWDESENDVFVFRDRFNILIYKITSKTRQTVLSGFDMPVQVMKMLIDDIETSTLPKDTFYLKLVEWKLFAKFVESLSKVDIPMQIDDNEPEKQWCKLCKSAVSDFAISSDAILKQELIDHPYNYAIYSVALSKFLSSKFDTESIKTFCELKLEQDSYICNYLVVLGIVCRNVYKWKGLEENMTDKFIKHSSSSVRIHYYYESQKSAFFRKRIEEQGMEQSQPYRHRAQNVRGRYTERRGVCRNRGRGRVKRLRRGH